MLTTLRNLCDVIDTTGPDWESAGALKEDGSSSIQGDKVVEGWCKEALHARAHARTHERTHARTHARTYI